VQVSEVPLPGPLSLVPHAQIPIKGAMGEQVIDDARGPGGGGRDGRFWAEPGAPAPVEHPQTVMAATDRSRRQSKRVAGAGFERARADDLPAGELVMGASPSQGQKALALGHCCSSRSIAERSVCRAGGHDG
jgi:hypothetical protein